MPHDASQRAVARRVLIEDPRHHVRRRWLEHGIAALAVVGLGIGVAGSIVLTGNAQQTTATQPAAPAGSSHATVEVVRAAGVAQPKAFTARAIRPSRSTARPALDFPRGAALRTEQSGVAQARTPVADASALRTREKQLSAVNLATRARAAKLKEEAAKLKEKRAKADKNAAAAEVKSRATGSVSLPVTSGYRVAARFGQVGAWARYHTGFDFSAPVGTPIHAPENGVVTTAGSGEASGWAGNYVTIRHPDGMTSLFAHMSVVTVHVGERVRGGQVIGHVGMTGRTFGAHVHFEIYPVGATPGDVYRAVDPEPWLRALGLRP